MKVSVAMITYNHEKFIAQAIESVLMQEVNFDYEIVIGEDCSLDKTGEIVKKYQERHSDKIRVLTREKNLGMQYNFVDTLQSCMGEYVALLEGDDYWTSLYKLQKQVDFLDSHPDFTICSHNVHIKHEGQSKPIIEWLGSDHKETMTIEDLLSDGSGGATCSLVFRNKVFGEFPKWYYQISSGDWALQILCATKGKMRYFRDVMGVYRKHPSGISSVKPDSQAEIDRFESGGVVKCEIINKHFDYRYDKLIRKTLIRYYYPNLIRAYVNNWRRTIGGANKYARKLISGAPSAYRMPMCNRIRLIILIITSDLLILLHKFITLLLI